MGRRNGYTRQELAERNRAIYADYLSGASMQELARKYFLSEKSMQRIIRQQRG
ncbi:MAG: Mor transcription activator family protein [Oscillospiraceae bacterium]